MPVVNRSERVAYGKVEGKAVFKRSHIVVTAASGFIRSMDADAKVGTQHQHVHVEAQTYAGAHSYVVKEIASSELRTRALLVFLQQPHIAHVEEYSPVQEPENGKTVFGIQFKFECLNVPVWS